MRRDVLTYLALQRQIFGVCPECQQFFRLSEAHVFLKGNPKPDWMDQLAAKERANNEAQARLTAAETRLRDKARELGRKAAQRKIKKIDQVFRPLNLNPDDAKVIFHPIDYVVFNGMKDASAVDSIILLDRQDAGKEHRNVQRSIEKAVEAGKYEWATLRVLENGQIEPE